MDCCFCGKPVEYVLNGNDARPIKIKDKQTAICCDECNEKIVIPTREYVWFNNPDIIRLELALQHACAELEDAKDMLRACGKNDWAGMIDVNPDYYKSVARAKGDDEK